MRVLPILFNTPMTQSVLAGNKTQTRRVVTPQPREKTIPVYENGVLSWAYMAAGICHVDKAKPRYQPGDILYVRETWQHGFWDVEGDKGYLHTFFEETEPGDPGFFGLGHYIYRADAPNFDDVPEPDRWRPSIYMPREAARIFLRVTDVRVERLQDSFNDPITPILAVQAEGIDIGDTCRECLETYICPCCVKALDDDGTTLDECGMLDENRGEFSDLWDSTIKKRDLPRLGWMGNPWVWVYSFKQISKEEAEQ